MIIITSISPPLFSKYRYTNMPTDISVSDNKKTHSGEGWLIGSPVPTGILRLIFSACTAPSILNVEWKGSSPESIQLEGVPDDDVVKSMNVTSDILTIHLSDISVEKLSQGGTLTVINYLR